MSTEVQHIASILLHVIVAACVASTAVVLVGEIVAGVKRRRGNKPHCWRCGREVHVGVVRTQTMTWTTQGVADVEAKLHVYCGCGK